MNKMIALLATTALLSAPAFAGADVKTESSIEHGKNGSFEAKTETKQVTEAGKLTRETKVDVDVDDNGEGEATRTTTVTDDPKGLMNKTETKTEETKEVEDKKE